MMSEPGGPIKLFVLGDARIVTPIGEIEPGAELLFGTGLYLILQRNEPVSRRRLEELLWPQVDSSLAAHRLRQTLLKLRKLGLPVYPCGRSRITLSTNDVEVDLDNLAIQERPMAREGRSGFAQVLHGFEPTFSAPYSEWLERTRADFGAAVSRLILHTIALHREGGRWGDVELWATTLRALTPFNEEATLALAEAHAMRGAKLEAFRILDDYLTEVGSTDVDLRVQAAVMRQRIANRPSAEHVDSRNTAFVGRSADLSILSQQLPIAKSGSGQACLVLGEAGIGKSRLLSEFASFAALQGFSVQRIQCRPSHRHQPLSAFVELAPILRGLRGAIGCSPETLADLDRLTSHRPATKSSTLDTPDSQWAYGRILRALFDIVDAVSEETPLLIQVEDSHWLDTTSAEVLGDMIEWGRDHRVHFALTAREIPDSWRDRFPSCLRTLTLSPLDKVSATDLLLGIAQRSGRHPKGAYLAWCIEVAEGNPYFLQELATHWIETGAENQVPPSLSALLESRVERLDADALLVLQACALLENNSSLARLEEIIGFEPHRLLHAINSLGSAGMMVVEAEDTAGLPSERIGSKHDLLSNVALQRLANPARVYLHRRIGLVLEREVNEHFSAAVLWDCAKHWRLGGDYQRALTLALSCARHLMDVGLSHASIAAYERCIPFCISDAQRLEVLEAEVAAFYRCSNWQRVREVTALARSMKSRVYPNDTLHDDLELMDLRAQWQSLEWADIAVKAMKCLDAADATPRHRVEAGIMALMLLGLQPARDDVGVKYNKVCSLIDEHSLSPSLRLQADMVYHTEFGELAIGISAARELITEQEAQSNIAELFRTYCNSAVTFRVAGLFDEADGRLNHALELAERYELEQSMIRVLPMLANVALERGNIDHARKWYNRLSELVIDSVNEIGMLEVGAIGVRLALLNNDGQQAQRHWPRTRKEAESDPIFHRRTYNCALQTAIDLALTGKPEESTLASLLEALELSKRGLHQAFNVCVAVAALSRVERNEEAEVLFDDYVYNHRREPWPVPSHLIAATQSLGPTRREVAQKPKPSVFR